MSDNQLNIRVTADSSGAVAAFDKVQTRIQKYADSTARSKQVLDNFQAALDESGASTLKQQQAIAAAVIQMDKLASTTGKTQAQLAAMKAENLGISTAMKAYISDIDAAAQHTHEFSLGTTAARRELLVLAHEASQGSWKQFGGSLLVLGERTDALSKLMSAGGVTAGIFAAAIFAVGKAAVQGAAEAKELNAAIQLTNNYAGLTRDTFADLAATVAGNTQTGIGHASEVLRGLAATGQYTSSEMEGLANVIVRTSEISGKSLEDVGKEYDNLAEDPAKWAYEHNQSMHFMDVATYQHIEALQKAGDKHAAIQAVIEATTKQVEQSSTQHLSVAAQAWRNLTSEMDTFWSKLKQGLSTGPSLSDQIATLEAERESISSSPLAAGRIADINKQIAALGAKQKAELDAANASKQAAIIQQAAVDAEKRMSAMRDSIMNNAEKRNKELQQLAKDRAAILAGGGKFSDDEYSRMASDINDKYKDHKSGGSSINAGINAHLAQLQGINKLIQDEEKRNETMLKAQRDAGIVDAETYLQKLHDLQANALDQEIANANQRADVAKGKKELAGYETALAEVQKLTAQRKQLDTDLTDSLARLSATRAANVSKFGEQEANALRKQMSGYTDAYNTRHMSSNAKAEYEGFARILEQYQQQVATLKEQYSGPTADRDEYNQKMAIAQQYYEESTAAYEQYLSTEKGIRESYTEQFHKAYVELAGNAQTNAEAVVSGFKTAFDAISSGLDAFVTTGKLSFDSFAAGVLADLAKIALHQAEIAAFKGIGSALGYFSDGGAVGHFATGGAISGPGSGTSDSIPAMLSNGEFVVNAASTAKYRGLLESINNGHMAHFATGGAVGFIQGGSVSGSGGSPVSVTVNNHGGSNLTNEDAKQLHTLVTAWIDKRMSQNMRGQGGYAYKLKYNQM